MKKKILFQLNELAYGGTTKGVLSFCKYLDRTKYDLHLFYFSDVGSIKYYQRKLESYFSKNKKKRFEEFYVKNIARKNEFIDLLGASHIHYGNPTDFQDTLDYIKPDIIHFNRGVEKDWFTEFDFKTQATCFETNIFGKSANSTYLKKIKRHFFVSQWLSNRANWCQNKQVLYNPILKPLTGEKLKILPNSDHLIIGRISRPGLDSGIEVLQIFNQIKLPCTLLVLGAGEEIIKAEADLDKTYSKQNKKVICLPATTDETQISQFYNSIDVLLHYRREGETFGMNIAEAMIHGKPVVSHISFLDNAQIELIAPQNEEPCGLIAPENNFKIHAEYVENLLRNSALRCKMGNAGQTRAMNLFEASVVAKQLSANYSQFT